MNYINNDLNIYYEKYGNSDKSIIILPGWGDNRTTFYHIIKLLKEYYTVYILDYPGFGNSPFPNRDLDIYQYSELIRDFINDNDINNPIIIGHSFGGRISILLSGLYKININKLILIDAAGIKNKKKLRVRIKEKVYKFLKKIGNLLPSKSKEKYLNYLISKFGSSDYKNLDPNIRKTFIKVVNEDLSKYLDSINVPTLIIWGEQDKDTPLCNGKLMNCRIKDSGLIIVPNSGHFPYLDFPYYINRILLEFLNS